ncbi:MAG: DUF2029 domain-containing protein [Spirochaetia bacterium]|nr:DUF2029 domain-containing protein [Spirochaetia bacterium]
MKKKIFALFLKPKIIFIVYFLFAFIAGLQSSCFGSRMAQNHVVQNSRNNNYIIFKQSYFHLLNGKNLYQSFPAEHWDLYKYSPTFALFFGLFANFPDVVGNSLWTILNVIVLFFAINFFPIPDVKKRSLILIFVFIELFTSIQNNQSNALIAGLIIFAFGFFEREKYFWAPLFLILTVFIKLFGIVAFALFIFYPQKWKIIIFSFFWFLILLLLPLIVVHLDQLGILYSSWYHLLKEDYSNSFGYSVMGWLTTWFHLDFPKNIVLITGLVLFCLPLVRIKQYKNFEFRIFTLSSILLWVVLFNHKAESPTFIIAICGVGIWYFSQEKKMANFVLLMFVFIITSLGSTDIFPKFIKNNYFGPYVLKVVPCIFIWIKIIYDMIKIKSTDKIRANV